MWKVADSLVPVSELGTFLSWCRYRYGVFPESGFPRDPIYPDMFSVGDEQRANQGCNSTTQMVSNVVVVVLLASHVSQLWSFFEPHTVTN